MKDKETKFRFFNITTLMLAGVMLLLIFAVILLCHGNANSMQAMPALVAQVYFDGEYRIADGQRYFRQHHLEKEGAGENRNRNFCQNVCRKRNERKNPTRARAEAPFQKFRHC